MNITKREEVEQLVASGKLHINLEKGAEMDEEVIEDALKFINYVKEKYKNERSSK